MTERRKRHWSLEVILAIALQTAALLFYSGRIIERLDQLTLRMDRIEHLVLNGGK